MSYRNSPFRQRTQMPDKQKRQFLQLGALSLGLAGLGMTGLGLTSLPLQATTTTTKIVPGLQLYTIRDLMAQSVPDTLKLVAGLGYTEVEFAGYFNQTAKQLKSIIDSEGLSAPSCHVPLELLQQNLDGVIEQALVMGHQYLVLPYLDEAQRQTLDQYKALAEFLNQAGERTKAAGLQLAYHNHEFEFIQLSGATPFDVLLNETDNNLVQMELDLYWVIKAGLNPLDYIAKHPGRFPLWHVKDMDSSGNFADVGKGVIDFKPIFAKAGQAGLRHAYVERDHTDNKIETIRQGFNSLSSLLA